MSAQKQTSQSGFTIIESLIAIAVVGILMTVIAPVIVLSVGNRVQARRVELATEASRSYVNSVRSRAIEAPKHAVLLNEISTTPSNQFNPQRLAFASVTAPTSAGSLTCTQASTATYPYCQNDSTSSLYCFDLDGDGCSSTSFKDMIVQAFRSVSPKGIRTTNTDKGYLLGVRVYRADAFSDTTSLVKSTPDSKRTQATFTGGLGSSKAPLLETTTEINTEQPKFQDFCDRLGGCKKDN